MLFAFENLSFDKFYDLLQDPNFNVNSSTFVDLTQYIGRIADSLNENQKIKIRNAIGSFYSFERRINHRTLKRKYPELFSTVPKY